MNIYLQSFNDELIKVAGRRKGSRDKMPRKKRTEWKRRYGRRMAAGGAAGAVATLLTQPFQNVQMTQISRGTRASKTIKSMMRSGKIRPFYRGMPMKMMKIVPTMAITFPVYHYISERLKKKNR